MVNFHIEKIIPACESFGVFIDSPAIERLNNYGNLLLEWNQSINLTAITEPQEVLYKHFYDCILFFKNVQVKTGAEIIDVGTGAGFPGMVLKIIRPDIRLTLLDGLKKRLTFLDTVLDSLGLEARTLHLRAEEGGKDRRLRESFDIACARAVANLPVLLEYCLPFVRVSGEFIAMKGPSAEKETAESFNALKVLGGGEPVIICETLTGNEQRTFVKVKKISQTPTQYPRISAKITKQPL